MLASRFASSGCHGGLCCFARAWEVGGELALPRRGGARGPAVRLPRGRTSGPGEVLMNPRTAGIGRPAIAGAERPGVPAPSFWAVTRNMVRRLVKGPLATPPPHADRDSLLLDASVAIRAGRVDDASDLLAPHAAVLASDPAYLNLLGIVWEVRRQWRLARRLL